MQVTPTHARPRGQSWPASHLQPQKGLPGGRLGRQTQGQGSPRLILGAWVGAPCCPTPGVFPRLPPLRTTALLTLRFSH